MRIKMLVLLVLVGTFGCESGFVDVDDASADSQSSEVVSQKSFVEYFTAREQFLDSDMPKDDSGIMNKSPEVLGFIELATIEVTCPDSMGSPCSGNLLILSQDPIHSGNQEFYLAFTMLPSSYDYYGPFMDDLERIVNESESIESLKK